MIDELLADAANRRTLLESRVLGRETLTIDEEERAIAYIAAHPDYTSYHLLFALPEARVQSIAPEVRAAVLCSALAELTYLNDWGHLTVSPREGAPSRALTEIGEAALKCLTPLLDDRREAPFFGSADATIGSQYRRADFAYRIAAKIAGIEPVFHETAEERDAAIAKSFPP